MGCDIHLRAEYREGDTWYPAEDMRPNPYKNADFPQSGSEPDEIPERWYDDRNYSLFSILAGVRNSRYLDPIKPISVPKGIPADASEAVLKEIDAWSGDGHSYSYLTLSELEDYDWNTTSVDDETYSKDQFEWCVLQCKNLWDDGAPVRKYPFTGPVISVACHRKHGGLTGEFREQCMSRMYALSREVGGPDNVRIVFWFDN